MAGWLGGGDADEGSPRARAIRFHGIRVLIVLIVAAITYLVFPASPVVTPAPSYPRAQPPRQSGL